jgi:hypothetical protein
LNIGRGRAAAHGARAGGSTGGEAVLFLQALAGALASLLFGEGLLGGGGGRVLAD